ncbi:hypothetical protein RRG08_051363 [Elysia crispata]|uniref:Uncharacterized protein n=1 Tax=Elysia crispata TaxID=231223 RepID=A0AAE1B402_9GAST|nr:hypothetical protein RRG08_051363 [Elysia crispata]
MVFILFDPDAFDLADGVYALMSPVTHTHMVWTNQDTATENFVERQAFFTSTSPAEIRVSKIRDQTMREKSGPARHHAATAREVHRAHASLCITPVITDQVGKKSQRETEQDDDENYHAIVKVTGCYQSALLLPRLTSNGLSSKHIYCLTGYRGDVTDIEIEELGRIRMSAVAHLLQTSNRLPDTRRRAPSLNNPTTSMRTYRKSDGVDTARSVRAPYGDSEILFNFHRFDRLLGVLTQEGPPGESNDRSADWQPVLTVSPWTTVDTWALCPSPHAGLGAHNLPPERSRLQVGPRD